MRLEGFDLVRARVRSGKCGQPDARCFELLQIEENLSMVDDRCDSSDARKKWVAVSRITARIPWVSLDSVKVFFKQNLLHCTRG